MKFLLLSFLLFTSLVSYTQVGIGTATPNSTAQLDVSSTTKGFLPPRMTAKQRDSIATTASAAGLIIWCRNCGTSGELQVYNGTAWTNFMGGTVQSPQLMIGDSYQGGVIAYLLIAGDPGYDANTQHGLIAATSDQTGTGYARWNIQGIFGVTGATGTAIGTGLSNTNAIIADQGPPATSYAAGLARSHTGGGYTDWYLPSKNELAKLYAMKRLGFGGFANIYYWSSTEIDISNAWYQDFLVPGNQLSGSKSGTWKVRAVRSF